MRVEGPWAKFTVSELRSLYDMTIWREEDGIITSSLKNRLEQMGENYMKN